MITAVSARFCYWELRTSKKTLIFGSFSGYDFLLSNIDSGLNHSKKKLQFCCNARKGMWVLLGIAAKSAVGIVFNATFSQEAVCWQDSVQIPVMEFDKLSALIGAKGEFVRLFLGLVYSSCRVNSLRPI